MKLTDFIGVRVSPDDRQLIAALARAMNRSEGEAVRQSVRQKAAELGVTLSAPQDTSRPRKAAA